MDRNQNDPTPELANAHLAEARERFAADWLSLRESLRRETGAEPSWSAHLLWPVLALAAGVAVGAGIWWRRSRQD